MAYIRSAKMPYKGRPHTLSSRRAPSTCPFHDRPARGEDDCGGRRFNCQLLAPSGRCEPGSLPSLNDHELMYPPAAVLGDEDIALRIRRDPVRLIELARQLTDLAEARKQSAGATLDNIDLRIVLVDDEHEALVGIVREVERH